MELPNKCGMPLLRRSPLLTSEASRLRQVSLREEAAAATRRVNEFEHELERVLGVFGHDAAETLLDCLEIGAKTACCKGHNPSFDTISAHKTGILTLSTIACQTAHRSVRATNSRMLATGSCGRHYRPSTHRATRNLNYAATRACRK